MMFYTSVICHETYSCPGLLEEAHSQLPASGMLMQNESGFLYLDIDDGYIHRLGKWIEKEGFEPPPYMGPNLAGAHITLVRPPHLGENLFSKKAASEEKLSLPQIEEVGQIFSFSLKECEIVKPQALPNVESLFIIKVEAPELKKLISQYDLPPLGFDFHITIGVKYKTHK